MKMHDVFSLKKRAAKSLYRQENLKVLILDVSIENSKYMEQTISFSIHQTLDFASQKKHKINMKDILAIKTRNTSN